MTPGEWERCANAQEMLEFLGDRASARKLRLLACAWCRQRWDLLRDERSRRAVQVAERYAYDRAGREELRAAYRAAAAVTEAAIADLQPRGLFGLLTSIWQMPARVRALLPALLAVQTVSGGHKLPLIAQLVPVIPPAPSITPAALVRDLFANPWHSPAPLSPAILASNGGAARRLAEAIYDGRRFEDLPILADLLEEAGLSDAAILGHLRGPGPHALGCWALDRLLDRA
jgi:hypothetical protein